MQPDDVLVLVEMRRQHLARGTVKTVALQIQMNQARVRGEKCAKFRRHADPDVPPRAERIKGHVEVGERVIALQALHETVGGAAG